MKKLLCLMLLVLCVGSVSCGTLGSKLVEPGDKIGEMTVEEHSTSKAYRELGTFCVPDQTVMTKPGTITTECEVPMIPGVYLDWGWGAKDETLLDSNWGDMTWEMYLDGSQINLGAFEPSNESWTTGPGRAWQIDFVNPTPGKHTLRVLWKSDKSIDDGFYKYAPGAYEYIFNFTVPDK